MMIQLVQNIRRVTRARAEGRRERGAALVEAAIAIPLLLVVIMGSIEFGFAWEAKSASVSGMRSGVLRAASLGDKPQTDMSILQSVIGEIGADKTDQIEWVMIFKADAGMTEEARIQNCIDTSSDCVMYFGGPDGSNSILEQIATTTNAQMVRLDNFDDGLSSVVAGAYQCDPHKKDSNWCAAKRTEGDQDVEFGLAVRYRHEWFTGIFPFNPPVFQDSTITSTFLHEGATSITPASNIPSGIGQVVNSAFNAGIDPSTGNINWSVGADKTVTIPSDPTEGILGRFNNESVNLTVGALGDHTQVCVSFDLYLIDSWDATDRLSFTIAGQLVRFDLTDATSEFESGFSSNNAAWIDRLVTFSQCFDHVDDSVSLDFSASGLTNSGSPDPFKDESWALDNVVVSVRS